MKPNESASVSDFPGEPVAADPVEVLAYALWNEGKKDEAIAVLERQIALEKKLARGGALPAPTQRAEMTLFPLPDVLKTPPRAPKAPARAANQNEAQSRRSLEVREPATLPARQTPPLPIALEPVTSWPRPGRRLALLSGALLLLVGGAGLWASADPDRAAVTSPAQQAATSQDPAEPGSTAAGVPALDSTAEGTRAVPAAPVAAAPQTTTANLPAKSAEPAGLAEPPSEDLPVEDVPDEELFPAEAAAEGPPAEDLTSTEPEAAVGEPRLPRSRAEPPEPDVAETPETAPAPVPRAAASAARPAQPRQASREPTARPATDSRSERSRRLAERREAAERYVARRRAEAERSAAAKRRGAAVIPDGEGPAILLGGRGLPN